MSIGQVHPSPLNGMIKHGINALQQPKVVSRRWSRTENDAVQVRLRQPFIVTGMHRSGTTWTGKMLDASKQMTYVWETLNPEGGPRIMRHHVKYWYNYICP